MLARIAHDIYWLGRHLVRAEHTARMLDGLFHADLQGRAGRPGLGHALLALAAHDHGRAASTPGRRAARRGGAARSPPAPTTRCRSSPASTRAREGARTLRDTISAEMWESVNTFNLRCSGAQPGRRPAHRALLDLRVRQGAQRAVLGPDRAHDAEGRGARLPGGGRAPRGGRHGAAHAARGDAAARTTRPEVPAPRRQRARAAARGGRVPGLHARRRRAAQRRPGHPLHALRARVPRLGGRVDRVAARRARARGGRPPGRPAGAALCAACWPTSTFRAAGVRVAGRGRPRACEPLQHELERLDAEIHERYFHPSRACPASAAPDVFAPLQRRVPLRRAGLRPAQRAARAPGEHANSARATLSAERRPERAAAHATSTTSAPRRSSST